MENIASLFTAMLGRLGQAVAAFMAVQMRPPEFTWIGTQAYLPIPQPNQPQPLAPEIWHRLAQRINRITQRLRTLFIRYQTNTLPKQRPARAHTPSNRPPEPRLPTTLGWISAHIPAAGPSAGHLEYLLQTPQMQQFVQAAPQAGRLLRPLAQMLGIAPPEYLRLPKSSLPSPRPPRGGWAAKRTDEGGSSPTHPPYQATPNRPLQPEIRAAARAWKKYDR